MPRDFKHPVCELVSQVGSKQVLQIDSGTFKREEGVLRSVHDPYTGIDTKVTRICLVLLFSADAKLKLDY